ncbi:HIR complex subunit [Didymella pomorum]
MDANDASSPGSLSSPPHSPEGTPTSTVRVSSTGVGVGPANTSTPTPASATSPAPRGLTASGQPRKKPGPKPKPKDPNALEPEKKTRKPRKTAEPKDPNAAPVRKRRAKASMEAQVVQPVQADEKPVMQNSPTPQPRPSEPAPAPVPQQSDQSPALSQTPRVQGTPIPGTQEPTLYNNPNLAHINVPPTTPRPSSSGQRYDPIRGGIMEDKPQIPASAPPPISPPLNRASASPSITSLIDPPSASNSFFSQPAKLQQQASITSAPQSPASFHTRPASVLPSQEFAAPQPQPQTQSQQPTPQPLPYTAAPTGPAPMEIDSDASKPVAATAQKITSSTNDTPVNTNAPTPPAKPGRQKEAPPPLPSGSGLLSGTAFGPVTSAAKGADGPVAPNIYLHFDLKGRQNTTINVALEIEKKYGFAALHPRIAARQERKRQMQAAGAALERAAGLPITDDMSVDLSENESNVEMGGMDDNASATENGGKKRRKRKQEDYDKEDDFIDDTELAWEQQALMAKDGFFVYSGPLVTEEKPAVERADGTVRRGRGRGRGGTTRGETSGRGRGRGGGPGSRGGQTVRKPRVTKADRAAMEQEKLAREKMGEAIAKQPAIPSTGPTNSA